MILRDLVAQEKIRYISVKKKYWLLLNANKTEIDRKNMARKNTIVIKIIRMGIEQQYLSSVKCS